MRKISALMLVLLPLAVYCQEKQPKKEKTDIGIGFRAGYNYANVTNASQINMSGRAGWHVGLVYAPHSHGIIGSRTEIIYSQHGYNYTNDTVNGQVNLDYIMMAQYMAIHITKYFEIDLGGQTAYLLTAKVDSSSQKSTGNAMVDQTMSYYNRFDYGYGGGVEIHPFMGLLIGARYSISLSNLFKMPSSYPTGTGQLPSFVPTVSFNPKNNVVQVYIGYKF
jgi:opacity protein-like surface antigen